MRGLVPQEVLSFEYPSSLPLIRVLSDVADKHKVQPSHFSVLTRLVYIILLLLPACYSSMLKELPYMLLQSAHYPQNREKVPT